MAKEIGKLYIDDETIIYFDDNTIKTKSQLTTDECFKSLAIANNSPWSVRTENWLIKYNQKYNAWVCTHYVLSYDGIESELYAYGNTKIEALQNCKNFFKEFQKKVESKRRAFLMTSSTT